MQVLPTLMHGQAASELLVGALWELPGLALGRDWARLVLRRCVLAVSRPVAGHLRNEVVKQRQPA